MRLNRLQLIWHKYFCWWGGRGPCPLLLDYYRYKNRGDEGDS